VRALRRRGPIDAVYIVLGLLVVCLGWTATYILRDALRNVALLLTLVPFVIFSNRVARQAGGRHPPVEPL
jgi:hypothetical protein